MTPGGGPRAGCNAGGKIPGAGGRLEWSLRGAMFAFVVYAVAVWLAAARWRRRWAAFAWVGAGCAGLCLVAWIHTLANEYTGGRLYLPVLRSLLYPYTALVGGVGLFIALLPGRRAGCPRCPVCDYDLAGLLQERMVCPECGTRLAVLGDQVMRAPPLGAAHEPAHRPGRPSGRWRKGPPPVVIRWPAA